MSILKLLFALNPKNLKLVKAADMTPGMAREIDSFLGKMGAVVNIGKYNLTPSQAKYWRAQRKELTKYENKLKELQERNKLSKKKEGIETLPEADVIDFPVKPKPPEGEPFAIGGRVKKLAELAKKTKSKLGEAPKTDLKKVRARVAADKKSTEELAKSEQIPVKDDDPEMFDDLFERMFGEYELEKLKKSGRKPNADGGLATLFEERG